MTEGEREAGKRAVAGALLGKQTDALLSQLRDAASEHDRAAAAELGKLAEVSALLLAGGVPRAQVGKTIGGLWGSDLGTSAVLAAVTVGEAGLTEKLAKRR